MKNSTFARFARAFFIFGHLADVLDLSTTWNDLFCSCPDDVSIWWQMFNFVSLPLKRWFQFNSRIVWTHFASVRTLNNSEMIAEMRSYIFIWRSCSRRRRVCLNSLLKRQSPTKVLLRTPVTQMIIFNQGVLLLAWNHFPVNFHVVCFTFCRTTI